MTIGDRIKLLRKEKQLTQTELGKILGIEKSTVSMYENNRSTPNDDIKMKIAKYFNVSVDYLIGYSDVRNPYEGKKEEVTKKDPFDAFETFAAHQKEGGITNEKDLANMVEDIVKRLLEEKEKDK